MSPEWYSGWTRKVNPALKGRAAECDGGMPVVNEGAGPPLLGARESYRGRLTGEYVEQGDPPWRWYYMTDLEATPEGFGESGVWCERSFLFLADPPEVEL